MDSRVTAVDIFCGAGGLTRGLLDAEIDVVAGYDIDEGCRYPYEHNNEVEFIQTDVRDLDPKEVDKTLGDEPTLIAGCAPCQPYSILTNAKSDDDDDRAHLLADFSRIVDGVRPTYVTMENVPGLKRKDVFSDFVDTLENARYHVVYDVLDCSRYGVPQRRKRLVLLAAQTSPIDLPRRRPGPAPTVKGAIGDLPKLGPGEKDPSDSVHRSADLREKNRERIQASKPGGTWEDWPAHLRLDCHKTESGAGYTEAYGRMRWDEPAPTVTTKFFNLGSGRFGHPEQERALTPREAAILQTFPRDYGFDGEDNVPKLTKLGELIGNAVPVNLARALGDTIESHARSAIGQSF